MRLSKLSAPRVASFVDEMLEGHSRAMTRKVLVSLRALLNTAQRQGLVAQNVALAIRVSAQARHVEKVEILTPDQVRLLLEKVSKLWRPWLVTAIFTGLRASEMRGLRWTDIDLQAGRLTVAQRADEKGVIGSPKSASSRRSLPLPPIVVSTLKARVADCLTGGSNLVFPNGAGNPEGLPNLQNRFWGPLQVECGLVVYRPNRVGEMVARPRHGLHVLRHFYASWLIDQGFAPKRVQELMGHSTIKLTLDTYGHLWPDDAADAVRFEAAETELLTPPQKPDATRTQQEPVTS